MIVARRLPILADTLQTCKRYLEFRKISTSQDVCTALEKTLDSCKEKPGSLQTISERVIVQESNSKTALYKKISDTPRCEQIDKELTVTFTTFLMQRE